MLPDLPAAWQPWLQAERDQPYFRALEAFLAAEAKAQAEVLPPRHQVFAALAATSPDEVKVVLLGQDPYPTPGHAHGLCFSVAPEVRPIPGSLRNIFKELASDVGMPPPPHGCLIGWARQGVLLLNTVLTVRAGEAGSHQKKGWEAFTDRIISRLNERPGRIVFILWGRQAQRKREAITAPQHAVVECAHPSPLSARLFLGCRCFSHVNRLLREHEIAPVRWDDLPAVKAGPDRDNTVQGTLF